jgi:hypothetical protein
MYIFSLVYCGAWNFYFLSEVKVSQLFLLVKKRIIIANSFYGYGKISLKHLCSFPITFLYFILLLSLSIGRLNALFDLTNSHFMMIRRSLGIDTFTDRQSVMV